MFFDGRNTDKNTDHSYGPVYETLLSRHCDRIRSVLEIGVLAGESLLAWGDAFPNAAIVGVDIDKVPDLKHDRITCHRADSRNREQMAPIVEGKSFDLIVDDGSHLLCDQLVSFFLLLPFVTPGGWYFIEDVQEPWTMPHWKALGFSVFDLRKARDRKDNIICALRTSVEV